jgi:peptide/nickel transport system ATP-binding protein/oligopeptide transport system ATP-binding protein
VSDILTVDELGIAFPARQRHQFIRAVDGVGFRVAQGETFGVIGESGSGKSTLGRCIVCLVRPTSGRVLHDGADPFALNSAELRRHRRAFQIIFQDPNAALDPRMTILDSVREPLDVAGIGSSEERRRRALAMLDRVALSPELAGRYPHEISGGQKQRANIARALVLEPRLIVCDEVVAALDVSIQADMLNLFAELQREFSLTYVFISHDLRVVAHVSDRVAVMYFGKLVELGPAQALMAEPLHPYTQALLSAEPEPMPAHLRNKQRIILKGEIPSPLAPPTGCRFHTRCPLAVAECSAREPEWREIVPGHFAACHFAGKSGAVPARAVVEQA